MVIKRREECNQVFVGRIVHSLSLHQLQILPYAALGVHKDGSIAFLDCDATQQPIEAVLEKHEFSTFTRTTHLKPSQFLFPGMIDTHLHAPQWPNLALGMEGELEDWIENYTDAMEASYSDSAKARSVYSDVVRTTLGLGTTTVAYNTTIHVEATNILAKACYSYGQRAILGKMCITVNSSHGNWETSPEQSILDSEKVLQYINQLDPERRLVHPSVQPRGGPWCPPSLMKALGDKRDEHDAYVEGHMCETLADIERTLKLHPDFECYTDMYRANGLLGKKSIMAHCIHLEPKDLDNLRETGAGVAHCPNSNTNLRSGECRVRDLLNHGIKVGLGTDCSAGYMPSIHSVSARVYTVILAGGKCLV